MVPATVAARHGEIGTTQLRKQAQRRRLLVNPMMLLLTWIPLYMLLTIRIAGAYLCLQSGWRLLSS
jgi:hypothetical protein